MNRRWIALPFLALCLHTAALPVEGQEDSAMVAEAEKFIVLLKNGDWSGAEAQVAPEVRDRLGATQLETVWGQLRAGLGELQRTELRAVTPADGMHSVELIGEFANQKVLLRVVLNAGRQVSGFWVVPVPAEESAGAEALPPYADRTAFREEEVQIGTDPWRLPGTLTLPAGQGPHPAVVLVHGSGPNDRDETVGGTKVFRDLAWGLATQGIAVLRYEKRTKVHGARMVGGVTLEEEVVDDALAALALAQSHGSVDAARVYVLGHSLGGQLAPAIARRHGGLAGAIMAAAPTRPIDEMILAQLEYLSGLPENAAPQIQSQFEEAKTQARRLVAGEVGETEMVMGATGAYFRELKELDAIADAVRLDIPLLVLQGGRDYQVTMEDFAAWQEALAGRPTSTLRSFPALNHLFVAGEGASRPAEYAAQGFVSGDVIDAIAAWIRSS